MWESEYSEQIKENEGYSTLSLAFRICSVGLGVLGYGVGEVAYMSILLGLLGVLLGILALTDKKQRKKEYAIIAFVLCPVGLIFALDALLGIIHIDNWL